MLKLSFLSCYEQVLRTSSYAQAKVLINKGFVEVAGAAGFEPATYGFGDRRSTS